ncbi:uncharacterized protein LOC119985210 isoform X1 [Tripterygium wilfordii]|uniref:uncharacterized protein LOC119985210 isoform X1 n=1 Tax=Tripterygium wilfordii TaxID=458696 RepID=UPI0018F8503A|nr:uncharacterized protein LOC119985210 isoform X1 [Tripterygium wilfordii]
MASSLHTTIYSSHSLLSLSKPRKPTSRIPFKFSQPPLFPKSSEKGHSLAVNSVVQEDFDVIPVQSGDLTDQQEGVVVGREDEELVSQMSQVTGIGANEGQLSLEGFSSASSSSIIGRSVAEEEMDRVIDRTINAVIVLAAGTFAISKLLTIDRDFWHGWTIYEILRYAPQHNWTAYEEALKTNPVLAKMVISGVVYSLGDWIAQCYEGKPLFEFDRTRMFRSGLVGFTLHGSLSHYYYEFCEKLFPFQDWWVVPAKVAFDQTLWAATWNSIYYIVLGFLRFESPVSIFSELKATFWPMLTAGWKLWPFAHLITYGVVPVEQRLLWVDCVELIWVTILSTYSNEKSEARISEAEASDISTSVVPEQEIRK